MKIVIRQLVLLALLGGLVTGAVAYDQPWNGNREDITGPDPTADDTDCASGNCTCPGPTNTGSPVYVARGFLVWQDIDVDFPSDTRVGLKRTYNSFDYRAGLFGRGWYTAQERSIARTYKAVTEGDNNSRTPATEYESVPIWSAAYGRRYRLTETETGCTTPDALFFTFEKTADGGFRQVYEGSADYNLYSQSGRLLESYDDGAGVTIYYDYDAAGRLVRQFDGNGFELSFLYNEQGFVGEVVDQADRRWFYRYDDHGRLIQVLDPDGHSLDYHYQTVDNIGYRQNLLTDVFADGSDPIVSVNWAQSILHGKRAMRVSSYTGANGQRHTYDYSETTTTTSQPGVRIRKTSYQVGSNTVIESRTYVADAATYSILSDTNETDGTAVTREYNDRGKVTESTDTRGNVTARTYNTAGRVTERTERAGTDDARVTAYSYWNNTNRIATINEYGQRESRMTYDSDLRRLTRTEVDLETGEERTWQYSYHPNRTDSEGRTVLGKVASINGPQPGDQDTEQQEYNDRGQLVSRTTATGLTWQYGYNEAGQQTQITDPNGVVTALQYDSDNRVVQISRQGLTYRYAHDGKGRLIQVIDPMGRITNLAYTDEGKLSQVTEPSGATRTLSYDYRSDATHITERYRDSDGAVVYTRTRTEDPINGRTLGSALASENQSVADYQYNDQDDLVSATRYGQFGDATTATTGFNYDAEGRLITTEDAEGGTTALDYDLSGRLVEVIDPNTGITEYQYNAFGEMIQQNSPDTGTETRQYRPDGRLSQSTNGNGQVTGYQYDALGRVTGLDHEGDALDIALSYDQGSNGNNRLTQVSDASGQTGYRYDEQGRVTDWDTTIDGVTFNLSQSYNDAGQRVSLTYPSGANVAYQYDASGRLTGIDWVDGSTTTPVLGEAQWRGRQLQSYRSGNGLLIERHYDASGRLTEQTFDTLAQRQQQLDNQGQVLSQTWNDPSGEDHQEYSYDRLSRLLAEITNESSTGQYRYDANGNRLEETWLQGAGSENKTYSYTDASNRLDSILS